MRVATLIFALCSICLEANAQVVPVRSGEHETFTRLVFSLPRRVPFNLVQRDRELTLGFEQTGWRPDLSSVFNRVPKRRLQEIEYSDRENGLILTLNCACDVTTFWFNENFFVLDISDPAESVGRSEDAKNDFFYRYVRTFGAPDRNSEWIGLPTLQVRHYSGRALERILRSFPDETYAPKDVEEPTLDSEQKENMSDHLRDGLKSSQVSRSVSDISAGSRQAELAGRPELENTGNSGQIGVQIQDLHSQITVRGADQDTRRAEREKSSEPAPNTCIDENDIDFNRWAGEKRFIEELGARRSAIFGERDALNLTESYKLVMLYLYYGFGAEANAVLALSARDKREIDFLRAIGEIIENGRSVTGILDDQRECGGLASFWGLFYDDEIPSSLELDRELTLQSFASLSHHLRRHLGPVLSKRLQTAGFQELSDEIVQVVLATEIEKTPVETSADAHLNVLFEVPGKERSEFADRGSQMDASDTIVRRIDNAVSRGEDVSADVAELAGAFAFEHSDQPNNADVQKAYVIALGASGDFKAAYDLLDDKGLFSPEEALAIRSQLASLLVEKADRMDILKLYFSKHLGPIRELPEHTALSVAETLYSAGFLKETQSALNRTFSPPLMRPVRLLRARIYLDRGFLKEARTQLLGLQGSDVDQLNDQILASADNEKQDLEYSGATQTAISSQLSSDFADESLIMDDEPAVPNQRLSTNVDNLQGAMEVLSASTNLREQIVETLSEFPLP